MSGHSKWSTIKRKKGAADAKRGKIFTKLIKEITVAARQGGGDPTGNPRLRSAISTARTANMPMENIDRAIKKGTGELEGMIFEEITYEGYGPGGAAVLVEVVTDNKKRIVSEVRHTFSKYNGSMGEAGCVAWMFDKRGLFVFDRNSVDEDTLMEVAIDAGAQDVVEGESEFEVLTEPQDFETVKEAFEEKGLTPLSAEVTMIPQSTVKLEGRDAEVMLRLLDILEDNDDVQNVYANFDISEEDLEKIG